MIMTLIKTSFVLLLTISFSVLSKESPEYSSSYTKCLSGNVDNPMSTSCIESEIGIQNKIMQSIIEDHRDITSPENGKVVNLNSYSIQQQKYIDDKCSLWLKAGGQNGVLLEKQCVLDETISLKRLLSNFVSTVDD